jgi:hypothetical protein
MITLIIGVFLATYAYRRGLRPRSGEAPAPIFAEKYGRAFAAFTLFLGIGIIGLSLKSEWDWGSHFAVGVATWFGIMNAGFKKNATVAQEINTTVTDEVQRDRRAWTIAFAIWLAAGLIIPLVLINVIFGDQPSYAAAVDLLCFGAMLYVFALPPLQRLVARSFRRKRDPLE